MRTFSTLYQALGRSTATLDKRAALVTYFRDAPSRDAAWALYLLAGGKLSHARRKVAAVGELRAWASEASSLPMWLVEASYEHVGDLAETLALLMPDPAQALPDRGLADWIEQILLPVANQDEAQRKAVIIAAWKGLVFDERLVFNKLLTGALRVGVSQGLAQQALADMSGIPVATIAQRMMGRWTPDADFFTRLLSHDTLPEDRQQPYPFFLASPLDTAPEQLGNIRDWILEWKWDGIRAQLIKRQGEVAVWSRGEERLDGRFPEVEAAIAALTIDCVLDGELLAWQEGATEPMPFSALQTRIQRLKPGPKSLRDAPVCMLVYDLLELNGKDLRSLSQEDRRQQLEALLQHQSSSSLRLSPRLAPSDWGEALAWRKDSRERGVEGFMIKRASASYQGGRRRGDWWKWKVDPLTIDAVLLYAQAGHGRRSTLYTDYTFGVWDGETLVPVAKAYSGLDDKEILALDRWIRAHTRERFGPVRSVEAVQVFELGFEGVNRSKRHKSGVAVRFPRILRWRHDKPATEADQLSTLQALAR